MPDDYKNEEEWHARKRCGETPFQDDFLEQSIKGATSTSQEKVKRNWLFFIIFVVVALITYFLCEISFMRGGLKERESKDCVKATKLSKYQNNLSLSNNVLSAMINNTADLKQEILFWKNSYSLMKEQKEKCEKGEVPYSE